MPVVITGANRGIGKALRDQYVASGAKVLGTGRKAAPDLFELDVTKPQSLEALTHHLDGRPVGTLICNAGVYLDKGADLATGYPAEMWAKTFAVNVAGVFMTVQALLPNLQMRDGTKIAIISSAMGSQQNAPGGSYIYRASKAAALNVGRNLAQDLGGLGIAVGIYHPGWVRTDMGGSSASVSPEESAAGLQARINALTLETTGCFETYDGVPIPF